MFMPPSERSPNAPQRLHLVKEGRLLAGVCAGLAVYPGWMGAHGWRGLFVVGAVLTLGPAAFVYIVLWLLMREEGAAQVVRRRERRHAPMPKVSWRMRRRLKRLVELADEVRRRHDPQVADLVHETLDAIKLLGPRLQRPRTVRDERLAEAALVRFPALIEKLQAMSPDDVTAGADRSRRTPGGVLLERLHALHDGFIQEATRDVESAGSVTPDAGDGQEAQTLHDRIRPLAARLGQSGAAASVGTLEAIIGRLEFLLERVDAGEDGLDLRPFKVRRIAFDYLPQALERYLQLPPELAGRHRIAGGRTAAQVLQDQLELLDARLGDLTRSYYEKDAAALLVHGRFLRDTFGQGGLQLDDGPADLPAASVVSTGSAGIESSLHAFGHSAGRSRHAPAAAGVTGDCPTPGPGQESARSLA